MFGNQKFGLTRCRYDTNMVLVDFNLAIGYSRPLVLDPNPTVQSVSVSVPDAKLTIISVSVSVPDANLTIKSVSVSVPDANHTIKSVSVSVPDADLTIKSYRHQVPTVTEYPRRTSSSRQFFFISLLPPLSLFLFASS